MDFGRTAPGWSLSSTWNRTWSRYFVGCRWCYAVSMFGRYCVTD